MITQIDNVIKHHHNLMGGNDVYKEDKEANLFDCRELMYKGHYVEFVNPILRYIDYSFQRANDFNIEDTIISILYKKFNNDEGSEK